jgi:tetratricopeptide (TPR) repeat protein/transcriptional regulator with XRE-family HTH domain
MRIFGQLLKEYMERTGISDAELARTLGVRRQTIFRWKEGVVARPRHVEDVRRCAKRLRLTPEERDMLLVSAGFPPENPTAPSLAAPAAPDMEENASRTLTPAAPAQGTHTRGLHRGWWVLGSVAAVALIALLVIAWARRPTYPVARDGETLLLVAPFVNYVGGSQGYNVAGRIQEALAREIDAGRLSGVRAALWPQEIRDPASAQAALDRSAAGLLIWGEYDSGRVVAHLSRSSAVEGTDDRRLEKLLPTPTDLSATINTALPEDIRFVALLSLAQWFADRADYDGARAALVQTLARPPADAQAAASAYFLLGYVDHKGEPTDLEGAIEAYSQALEAKPAMASAGYNRALAYLQRGQTGDYARAVDDLDRAAPAMAGDAALYTNRGAAYLHLASQTAEESGIEPTEAVAQAIEDFDRAIALDAGLIQAYFDRGLAYVRQDNEAQWLADFEHVLSLQPDHAGAYNALCWAYALARAPETALPYCERAVKLDTTGGSLDSRAIVLAELGRYEEAVADLEAYLLALQAQDEAAHGRNGSLREDWIRALRSGQDPFDRATLERLRLE